MVKLRAMRVSAAAVGALVIGVAVSHAEPAPQPDAPRFTFSWPLDAAAPTPRGGTTQGAPVTVDTGESPGWHALQERGLKAQERDRRAILAMAGEYRVTFDFLEIATFEPGLKRDRPYQSWGTERVYVDADTGTSISLVHLLEMRLMQPDGSVSEPIVTKHWRQDWQYEPTQIVEYVGRDRWQRRALAPAERTGRWSQTVYQVDESPRYASLARWEHTPNFSTWNSGDTWRPLPRREWSARKDYQVLAGTNRVTIITTGWLQEENNLKVVLTDDRRLDAAQPYLAREYGVARYDRLREADFAAATEYFERTRKFWDEVRATWSEIFRRNAVVTLKAPVDQAGLFVKLFAYADQLAEAKTPDRAAPQVIQESLHDMGAPVEDGRR